MIAPQSHQRLQLACLRVERFEASLGDAGEEVRRQFYVDNFLFLMGTAAKGLAA